MSFLLQAKHFYVLSCYFMKREDSVEKFWFWGQPELQYIDFS